MRLAPANSSAQRPAESVDFIGSTSVLSAYLLNVFCKWPIQKGHFVKIWLGHYMNQLVEIEMDTVPVPMVDENAIEALQRELGVRRIKSADA
jgi:hypothetical protein